MARIIQDSEDEDDFVVTSPAAIPSPSNSLLGKDEPTTRSKSTSETDVLRREIRNAQQQLVDHSNHSNAYCSSEIPFNCNRSSPSRASANKRRKTSDVKGKDISDTKSTRRKTLKTYGNSHKQGNNIFSGQKSNDEVLREYEQIAARKQTSPECDGEELVEQDCQKSWNLPPSIHDDFVQHNPSTMFPDADASSTIPNNTFTQRRLIEEALSVDQVVPNANPQTQASVCSEYTIPWSDSTQGAKSQPLPKSSCKRKPDLHPTSQSRESSNLTLTSIAQTNTPVGSPAPGDPRNRTTPVLKRSTKIPRTKTAEGTKVRRNSIAESIDELSIVEPAIIKISRPKPSASKTSTCFQDKGYPLAETDARQDVAATGAPNSVEARVDVIEPQIHQPAFDTPDVLKRSEKRFGGELPEIDELLSGLPTENYKPRPSRSRSTQLVQGDTIAFSSHSERVVRGKGKRRKTANDNTSSSALMSPSQEIELFGNMGFSPVQARLALKASSGDVEQAIDQLVTQSVPTSKSRFVGVAISPLRMRPEPNSIRHGQPDNNALPTDQVDEMIAHEEPAPSPIDLIQPARSGVEVETSNFPILSPIHVDEASVANIIEYDEAKHLKSSNSMPTQPLKKQMTEANDIQTQEQPNEQPKEKRKRGRPRKVVEAIPSIQLIHDAVEPPETSKLLNKGDGLLSSSPLKEVAPNARALIAKIDSGIEDENFAPPSKSPEVKPPASTPENKQDSTSALAHSPLNKSKVPYRIGLSKRARIAPLLRTMKK